MEEMAKIAALIATGGLQSNYDSAIEFITKTCYVMSDSDRGIASNRSITNEEAVEFINYGFEKTE